MPLVEFMGNRPGNVVRDAKYSLRRQDTRWVPHLEYRIGNNERVLLSTIDHPGLVLMVQSVQEETRGQPGGAFYINEYSQVIVPSGAEGQYYLAGEYSDPLEFEPTNDPELSGWIISGDGMDREGRRIAPGDEWVGPHPGIPYILAANLRDVYYELHLSLVRTRKINLSDETSTDRARAVAKQISEIKGSSGRFYINEFCQMFCPQWDGSLVSYKYVGALDIEAGWFRKWEPAKAA
jgi:hypothetical protein